MTTNPFDVIDATWPAASLHRAGGFVVREGLGGGKRVSAASVAGAWTPADIELAEAVHHALGQCPLFMIRPEDAALDAALAARGYDVVDPVVVLAAPVAAVATEAPPPITAFCHWPPLAIQRDLWAEGGIGPARLAVMARAAPPKCALLGRTGDRAAGVGFVALHQGVAMVHAMHVLPALRRQGLARWMLRAAALWAAEAGAQTLALVVTQANAGALALYRGIGLAEVSRYHYRQAPEVAA